MGTWFNVEVSITKYFVLGSDIENAESRVVSGRKLKEVVSARQMRRRRRANNELPEESERRIAMTMMRRNALTLLECSTAWPFRWFHGAFYCVYCDLRFVDIAPFRMHVENEHMQELPTKERVFAKLTENNSVKVDVANLMCRLCRQDIDYLSLKDHIVSVHGIPLNFEYKDGLLPFKLEQNGFDCQICFERFATFTKLNEHMNTHYQNYLCNHCGKGYESQSRFRTHVQSHELGQFGCTFCNQIFPSRTARMSHRLREHKNGFRYACPRCPEMFKTFYTRARHLVDEHGEPRKVYDCSTCGLSFETSSKRAAHVREKHLVLTNPKILPRVCQLCSKRFVSKSKLGRHLRVHGMTYESYEQLIE